jgi:hypothetical protein
VDAIAPLIIYDIKTMNLILKVASSFVVGWFRLAALGAIAIVYAWYWLIPRITKQKSFMTPDERRREAQRLRRGAQTSLQHDIRRPRTSKSPRTRR